MSNKIEKLTVPQLQNFREIDPKKITYEEFREKLQKLADKYNLSLKEAAVAHYIAFQMLPDPRTWV